ncbi:hypothetical protein GCM10027026_27830 [Myroides odoratimimus subsp. xuanwuensis]
MPLSVWSLAAAAAGGFGPVTTASTPASKVTAAAPKARLRQTARRIALSNLSVAIPAPGTREWMGSTLARPQRPGMPYKRYIRCDSRDTPTSRALGSCHAQER